MLRNRPPIVCFPFIGDVIGGNHISAIGLIRCIDRSRFTPLVVLQHPDGQLARFFREQGVDVEGSPLSPHLECGHRVGPRQLSSLLTSLPRLVRFLRERDVAIVHTNDGRTHATWGVPARLAGARLLWHHRGAPDAIGLRYVAPWLAHRLVAVSEFAAPKSRRLAGRTKVVHSPFSTEMAEDRAAARAELVAELGCPPETRLIGFFGNLIARKRPLLFVDTIAEMLRQAPGAPVKGLLFGEPFEGAEISVPERAAALGISEHVRLMGFRYPGKHWLAACDLLLVPAVDEPFGRTLIEAMLLGTPVIATASGGNIEAIRHGTNGLLVSPENAAALATAANNLLADKPLYDRIANDAREDALGRFGEERHAEEIMTIYDALLASGGARPTPRKAGHYLPMASGKGA